MTRLITLAFALAACGDNAPAPPIDAPHVDAASSAADAAPPDARLTLCNMICPDICQCWLHPTTDCAGKVACNAGDTCWCLDNPSATCMPNPSECQ